jgi:hypothetical protein
MKNPFFNNLLNPPLEKGDFYTLGFKAPLNQRGVWGDFL